MRPAGVEPATRGLEGRAPTVCGDVTRKSRQALKPLVLRKAEGNGRAACHDVAAGTTALITQLPLPLERS